jgi:hypothetical protein
MSANNYSTCPRCVRRAGKARKDALAALRDAYGTVTAEDYASLTASVPPEPDPEDHDSLGEFYEIHGAENGTITVSFAAHCRECGLNVEFTYKHVIPEGDLAS